MINKEQQAHILHNFEKNLKLKYDDFNRKIDWNQLKDSILNRKILDIPIYAGFCGCGRPGFIKIYRVGDKFFGLHKKKSDVKTCLCMDERGWLNNDQ